MGTFQGCVVEYIGREWGRTSDGVYEGKDRLRIPQNERKKSDGSDLLSKKERMEERN